MRRIYQFCLLLGFALLLNSGSLSAQFSKVEIGVDGLTCSMCTRSTEMSIRKLDFVDSVKMNLANTNGIITFKKGMQVSVEKIAKAVKDAGFSVRYLKAEFQLTSQKVSNGSCFTYNNEQYKFIGNENNTFTGEKTMTFIGKEFMPPKEHKKWSGKLKEPCSPDKKTYYVTI